MKTFGNRCHEKLTSETADNGSADLVRIMADLVQFETAWTLELLGPVFCNKCCNVIPSYLDGENVALVTGL